MDDLISRAAALNAIDCWQIDFNSMDGAKVQTDCWRTIKELPAVDAVQVVYGHWIEDRTDILCSVCGARYKDEIVFMPDVYVNGKRYDGLKYCPNCGAKMDGEANG